MRIIAPAYEIINPPQAQTALKLLEAAGRVCYKSEDRITDDSAPAFIARILGSGHQSVIEHVSLSVRFVCDRGVSHELVRHRLAAYSQESTRYANYGQEKFGKSITLIRPLFWLPGSEEYACWHQAMQAAEDAYLDLLTKGAQPQQARSVLPNSLKTELIMTANLREWRHVFTLRCAPSSHPQIREIMLPCLGQMHALLPVIFADLNERFAPDMAKLEQTCTIWQEAWGKSQYNI